MEVYVSQANPLPMYQQIVEQLQELIITGKLQAEDNLPSIRQLAQSLTVSVITVKRAYQELEQEGWVYTRPGVGSFVAPINTQEVKQNALKKIEKLLSEVFDEARKADITNDEIIAVCSRLGFDWREDK